MIDHAFLSCPVGMRPYVRYEGPYAMEAEYEIQDI
jgi:hypothetical protein